MSTATPTDFGRAQWCQTTLDTTRIATGIDVAINSLVRRLTTKRGTLFFHRNYGRDVRDLLGRGTAPGDLRRYAADITAECESDPYVHEGTVRVTLTETKDTSGLSVIAIAVSADSQFGPFSFVVSIDKVTLAIIGVSTKGST